MVGRTAAESVDLMAELRAAYSAEMWVLPKVALRAGPMAVTRVDSMARNLAVPKADR